ncbi:class II aldolase/adducin family protein [Rhizobium sp. TRM95111]|uniref:class II aldolase/adducin family protein n=1 Tax=Rhizobium alarense TaxID=2846851 RepID=UPI001F344230|nr:class II aldolase/adducin family protein [Rhizobium alarense]MCF3641280.1 class II aldolase/adducin family protein [Rhizobium alarense]
MASFLDERGQVADACRSLAGRGYLAGTGGNVALRLDENRFAVTPSATEYDTVTAADVAVVRLDTLEQLEGTKPASIETGLHARMLRAFPSRAASVHTHQPVASAVALLHEALTWPPGADRERLGDHVGLVPYRPSGTAMLARALAKRLRPDVYAYLLASHGVICSAPTLDAAAAMIAAVEAAAACHIKNLMQARSRVGGEVRRIVLACLDEILTEEPWT